MPIAKKEESRKVNDKPIKIRLVIELEIEAGRVDLTDEIERTWFEDEILGAEPDSDTCLLLHSNELGGTLGTVKVLRIDSRTASHLAKLDET